MSGKSSLLIAGLTMLGSVSVMAVERPNIVFILTDDQATWSMTNSNEIAGPLTPHMDQLAKESLQFTRCYTNSPVCSPSRASLITGKYPTEVGVTEYISRDNGLNADELTWVSVLKDAGYRTALVGKWHLGDLEKHHPTHFGYDQFYGFQGGGNTAKDPRLEVDGKVQKVKGYTVELLTNKAIEYLEEFKSHSAAPFVLSLHYRAPHGPFTPVDETSHELHADKKHPLPEYPGLKQVIRKGKMTDLIRQYHELVTHLDTNIGRVLRKLDELELKENTVVVFTSDNGYNIGHHGIWGKGNGDWLSDLPRSVLHPNLKFVEYAKLPNMWKTSARVPLYVRWPGHVKAGVTNDKLVEFIDFFPTICEMAKVDVPKDVTLLGKNFLEEAKETDAVCMQHDVQNRYVMRGVVTDKWSYGFCLSHQFGYLYDLTKDPDEKHNLFMSEGYEEVKREMDELLKTRMMQINDPAYGDGEYPVLNARKKLPEFE
ncbi:hypothetical protein EYV94_02855 [Puteibacter caeruleilacunae]|nr:hypothetical protein EYV94_02855 [Puteibacter caeruleilacunae]